MAIEDEEGPNASDTQKSPIPQKQNGEKAQTATKKVKSPKSTYHKTVNVSIKFFNPSCTLCVHPYSQRFTLPLSSILPAFQRSGIPERRRHRNGIRRRADEVLCTKREAGRAPEEANPCTGLPGLEEALWEQRSEPLQISRSRWLRELGIPVKILTLTITLMTGSKNRILNPSA